MAYSDNDDDMLGFETEEDNSSNYDGDDYVFAEATFSKSQLGYVVLKEEDIRTIQKNDIERVSSVLSLNYVEAIVLLLHYRWSVSKAEDEWFTDEERVRKLVGLLKKPIIDFKGKDGNIECKICYEFYTRDEIENVSCGHPYCKTCWSGYISSKIEEGPGCLRFKCPEPKCSAVVGQDMMDKFTKEAEKEKYYKYFFWSYIEEGAEIKIKWCPSPGCEYSIDFGIGSGRSNYDVSCLCSYSFCWNCLEDAHRPVDCETVSKWIFKNNDEAENSTWILVNSKPCPKCKRPIEKNQGCNHMTCSVCRHEFCWICFGQWDHTHNCNKFKDEETDDTRTRAKNALDRYAHYYERWAGNQSSRLKAIESLEKLKSVQLKELASRQSTSETQLEFTAEAWLQIIECRRVLKWTYAYGYYLPEHEVAKKQFFEYLQGDAESGLERLHRCAEMELSEFVGETKDPAQDFQVFRKKLIDLTKTTKTYFENLVKALENGLADVATYNKTGNLENSLLDVAAYSEDEAMEKALENSLADVAASETEDVEKAIENSLADVAAYGDTDMYDT